MTSDTELGEMPGLRSTFQRCYETCNRIHHEGRLALVREGLPSSYALSVVLPVKQRVRVERMRTLPGKGKKTV